MATYRLYYDDCFLQNFTARVLACVPAEPFPTASGTKPAWEVLLDRTAFYPSSGGQPNDLGKLSEARVLDVRDDGDVIAHIVDQELPVGAVDGCVDWPRRFDHMQQHTGQHLLSAAFIELFGFQTKSFHLGRLTSTIDLEAPSLTPRQLEDAERRTNEIIFEDREVAVRFGTAQELAEAGIRKTVEREGVLRAIEVEGFDRQPCGGTHLARTGQAGLLLIRKLERSRNLWRVEYVAGYRALSAARADFGILTQAGSLLTCATSEVPTAIAKLTEERRGQHTAGKKMEERLAQLEARELLEKLSAGSASDSLRIVAATLNDATASYLGILAAKLIAESNVVALVGSRAAGHVVFAQSKGSSSAHDLGALLRETLKDFGGKGGGSKDFAQGSVPNAADLEQVVQRAQKSLSSK